jgi:hypothetical protein
VPVRLEKIDPQQAQAKSNEVESAIRIIYLHRQDSFEDLLFDNSMALLGKFEQSSRRRIRIWDAVSPKELQERFNINLQDFTEEIASNATIRTNKKTTNNI